MVAQNNIASSDNRLVQTSPSRSTCGPVHLVHLGAECNHVAVVTIMAKVTAKNAEFDIENPPAAFTSVVWQVFTVAL